MSLPAPWDFYFRAFRSPGSPRAPAGYHYEAKLRIASAGLSPASTAASLAALWIPRPSGLSLLYYPGLPPSAYAGSPDACTSQFLPHRYWPSGRGNKPLATPVTPLQSASCGGSFRRLVRSLSLRPSWLLAPWADQTREAQCPPGHPGLLHPGFQVAGSPRTPAGYDYEAKLRISSAGLSPASTAASLAAPPPGNRHSSQGSWPVRLRGREALQKQRYGTSDNIALQGNRSGHCVPRQSETPESSSPFSSPALTVPSLSPGPISKIWWLLSVGTVVLGSDAGAIAVTPLDCKKSVRSLRPSPTSWYS